MNTPAASIDLQQNGSVAVATAALAAAYGLDALLIPLAAILLLGVLWVWVQRASWQWVGWVMLVLFIAAAGAGAWLGLNAVALVIGLVGALSAWDLGNFARRLRKVDAVEHERSMKRRHLRRLMIVDGLGLVLTLLALTVEINLSFGIALVLGLIALLALSRATGFLGRQSG